MGKYIKVFILSSLMFLFFTFNVFAVTAPTVGSYPVMTGDVVALSTATGEYYLFNNSGVAMLDHVDGATTYTYVTGATKCYYWTGTSWTYYTSTGAQTNFQKMTIISSTYNIYKIGLPTVLFYSIVPVPPMGLIPSTTNGFLANKINWIGDDSYYYFLDADLIRQHQTTLQAKGNYHLWKYTGTSYVLQSVEGSSYANYTDFLTITNIWNNANRILMYGTFTIVNPTLPLPAPIEGSIPLGATTTYKYYFIEWANVDGTYHFLGADLIKQVDNHLEWYGSSKIWDYDSSSWILNPSSPPVNFLDLTNIGGRVIMFRGFTMKDTTTGGVVSPGSGVTTNPISGGTIIYNDGTQTQLAPLRSDYIDGPIGDIQYGFASLLYYVTFPFILIGNLFVQLITILGTFLSSVKNVSVLLTSLTASLPVWISGPVSTIFIVTAMISIISFLRGK